MSENVTLAKKYGQQFLESDKKNKILKSTLDKIIEKEEQYKWSCVNWTEDQVKDFLFSLKSISPNTISRVFSCLRNLVDFICKHEKIDSPEFILDCDIYNFIDYDKLLSGIVSYEELKDILKQLGKNSRIKLIAELAWSTLTNEQIKNLKEEDIEFTVDDILGIETAVIKLSEDRCIVIEDQEIIKDIKNCIGQTKYSIDSTDYSKRIKSKEGKLITVNVTGNRTQQQKNIKKPMQLKESKYLIKPVLVGKKKDGENEEEDTLITNPSLTMQKALQQQGVTCPGIDVNKLTIENIRKSKIVYMLHNKEFFSKSDITDLLGGGNKESHLYWLEKIAAIKYDKK